jgi:hypothetical protein
MQMLSTPSGRISFRESISRRNCQRKNKIKKVIRLRKGASLLINECCMKLMPQNYVEVPSNSTSILAVINARLTSLKVMCCIGVK